MKKKIIITVASVLLVGSLSYFGYKSYVNSENEKRSIEQGKKIAKQEEIARKKIEAEGNKKKEILKKYDNLTSKIKQYIKDNPNPKKDNAGSGFGPGSTVKIKADKSFEEKSYTNGKNNKFSLYAHNDSNKPLIMSIHGGAFRMGDKSMEYASLKKFYEKGYNVMSIDYTLSGEKTFPEAINDVKKAINYIKNNYSKYNLKNNKIIVKGESAGGNLAALAGLSSAANKLNTSTTTDTKVLGVIDQYGPINFPNFKKEMDQIGITPKMGVATDAGSPEEAYLGSKITVDNPKVKEANPETYISKDMPHIYIQAGYKDDFVGVLQSVNFAKNIELSGNSDKVKTKFFEEAGHGGSEFDSDENITELDKWISSINK